MRRLLPLVTLIALLLIAAPAALADYQNGSSGKGVMEAQKLLALNSYLPGGAVDGQFGYRTEQAVMAFQGYTGLERTGVIDRRTLRKLRVATRPEPWRAGRDHIEVHIDQQVLLLVEDGKVKRTIHVSTGAPGRDTVEGNFTIERREEMSYSKPYNSWMPWAQYFHEGYALHEYGDVPGYPASHGCVRLPADEAKVVWRFGKMGMMVRVH